MGFVAKDWRDLPDHSTPITAAALEDLETRVTDYADTLPLGTTFNDTYNVTLEAGASVAQGVDVWASEADPGSVTDWGPIISSLIAGGAKLLFFGGHDFPYSTMIDMSLTNNVTLKGIGGSNWFPAGAGCARLIWKGAGGGYAIDVSGSEMPNFEDISFQYDDAFTGTLVQAEYVPNNINLTGQLLVRRCGFSYASQSQPITAAAAFNLNQCIRSKFEDCNFEGFMTYVSTSDWSNTCKFLDCVFEGACQYSVLNPGDSWVFDNCIFESTGGGGGGGAMTVDSHIKIAAGNAWGIQLSLRDCTHWDATDNTTTWVDLAPGVEAHLRFDHCVDHTACTTSLNLLGNGVVSITGGLFGPPIDVGDASDTDQRKNAIAISGIETPISNLHTGHKAVDVAATWNLFESLGDQQGARSKVFAEIADNTTASHVPASTVPAGAPAGFTIFDYGGNDRAGFVECSYGGGGTSGTGSVVQVAFGSPPPGKQPRVTLTPRNAGAVTGAAYVVIDDAHPEYFRIAITTGITAHAAWNYLVTWN